MKTQLECIPCILRQTIETTRLATDDPVLQRKVINEILKFLTTMDFNQSPPANGKMVYEIIHKLTGNYDPYKELKRKYNAIALAYYDKLLSFVFKSPEPVKTAAKLAVVGNIIDFGAHSHDEVNRLDLKKLIQNVNALQFEIDHFEQMIDDLKQAHSILYLADNAGEIVFDRLFIEILQRYYPELGLEFSVAVRGAPIINDVTIDDARMVGIDRIANIINNGDNAPATVLENTSKEMQQAFAQADLIISKGMGNYETLDERPELIYYLLKVKCPIVARAIGAKEGSLVLKRNERYAS